MSYGCSDGRKYPFYWLRFASPVKLHLRSSNPQLTHPTLQIQYCHSLITSQMRTSIWHDLFRSIKIALPRLWKCYNLIVNFVVLYLKSWMCQLWIWWSQMQFYWRCEAEPVKRIFATVKSKIDTDNSSNTGLLNTI
jgi:hypothetical protein